MTEYTKDQKQAIFHRGSPALVSAGAGSGKTTVLTDRLINYVINDGAEIDSFVVITFTKSAAAELRGRISRRLTEEAKESGNAHLRRQIAKLRNARIGTIHSFCAGIIRENAHELGMNPGFSIMSEERASSMKDAVLESVLDERYGNMSAYPGFEELVNTAGAGRSDAKLVKLALDLYEDMQCHPDPEAWASSCVEQLSAPVSDISETVWGKEVISCVKEKALRWEERLDALLSELAGFEQLKKAYAPAIEELAAWTREYIRLLDAGWDAAVNAPEVPSTRLSPIRGTSENDELKQRAGALKKDCASALKKLKAVISAPGPELAEEMATVAPPMKALLALVLDFGAAYDKEKRRLNTADYSDLEHKAAQYLEKNDISGRFTEVMVDEYQDVSRVQDYIFKRISGNGRKLFMVGDIKQSIYRFRLADPAIFKEKANEAGVTSITLKDNFRSRREIIDCANAIFSPIMTDSLGDTDYKDSQLVYGAKDYTGSVPEPELFLVQCRENADRLREEAEFVASKIESLVAEGTAGYGDIAILLRSPGRTGEVFARELTKRGIPVSAASGGSFFDTAEVTFVVSYLRILDNPHNDVPLIAVLRNPSIGFTADDLSDIRAAAPRTDFYTALVKAAESDPRVEAFLSDFNRLRFTAPDLSAEETVRAIMVIGNMDLVCSALPGGEGRMLNLSQLISAAVKFETDGYRGLHRFICYLDKLREKKTDLSVPSDAGSAVKIMSVHKSKGLEFKVVFYSNLQHQFNTDDTKETVLVHPVLGLGPKVTDTSRMLCYPSLPRNAISMAMKKELLSEEMRLMYVAVTRAKEHLFMTAGVDDAEKTVEKAKTAKVQDALCPLTWILASGGIAVRTVSNEGAELANAAPETKPVEADAEMLAAMKTEYAFAEAARLPSKVTATELKHIAGSGDEEAAALVVAKRSARMPDFSLENRPVTATERGIATHLCLQYMDFTKPVKDEIARLLEQKFLSPRQAEAVDPAMIEKLLASKTGKRMACADKVHREFRFSVLRDAEQIFKKAPGEKILLQGVVDCCLEEDGELVIIDYKTDSLKTEEETEERAKMYAGQVRAYADALSGIFGKPVRECVLYFLSNGVEKTLAF